MIEGSNYSATEECSRCLLKARSSKEEADLWAWVFLSKSWLNLINVRRGYDHQPETFDPAHNAPSARESNRPFQVEGQNCIA
jgi:hypothetical protein